MTDKNIFSAAHIFAGARLSALCICLFLLMVFVQSGIYTPQGKGGDFLSWDWPVIILLLWIGFISFRHLPVWRLKRKGLNKRQIRRAKRLSDRALQSPKGILFHFVYSFHNILSKRDVSQNFSKRILLCLHPYRPAAITLSGGFCKPGVVGLAEKEGRLKTPFPNPVFSDGLY